MSDLDDSATLVTHVNSQAAKAWTSKRGLGRMKYIKLMCMFVRDIGERVHSRTKKI